MENVKRRNALYLVRLAVKPNLFSKLKSEFFIDCNICNIIFNIMRKKTVYILADRNRLTNSCS